MHSLHPSLLASSLLHCLCWSIAMFVGTLPPPLVNQKNSVKPLAGYKSHRLRERYKQNMDPLVKTLLMVRNSTWSFQYQRLCCFL